LTSSKSRVDFALKYNADVGVLSPINKPGVEPLKFATDFMKSVIEEHDLGSGVDLTIEASGAESCAQMAVVITKPGGMCESMTPKQLQNSLLTPVDIQAGLGKALTSIPLFLFTAKGLTMKGK
jgi:D-xylulose reductase